jgi:hypothetical protein
MEPHLRNGDLGLVSPDEDYSIGRCGRLSTSGSETVIHRIVAVEGGRFVIQGDHNDWTDSFQPTQAEIQENCGFIWITPGKSSKAFSPRSGYFAGRRHWFLLVLA